jgi:hypothetical protein
MSRLLAILGVAAALFLYGSRPEKSVHAGASAGLLATDGVGPRAPDEDWETEPPPDPSFWVCGPELDRFERHRVEQLITADPLGPPPSSFGESVRMIPDQRRPAPAFARRFTTNMRKWPGDGFSPASHRAVSLGLAWLARQQMPDGGWELVAADRRDRAAATGLALLPFLGVGETHIAQRDCPDNKYRQTVALGLAFLRRVCPPSGPNAGRMSFNFRAQSVATLALVEAYAMTKDPALKYPAQAALNYLQRAQAALGGWPEASGGEPDLVTTGWAVQALHAGCLSDGLVVDSRVLEGASKFLDALATGPRKSNFSTVRKSDARPGTTPTAIGLLCRHDLDGWGPGHPGLIAGVAGLLDRPPESTRAVLHAYYATQVAFASGGENWKGWNEGPKQADGTRKGGVRSAIIASQVRKGGPPLGSWEPEGEFGKRYGRLGTTALNVLTLEVYFRSPRSDTPGRRVGEGGGSPAPR